MSVWNESIKGGKIEYTKTCCSYEVCTCLFGKDICPSCGMEITRIGKSQKELKVKCPKCSGFLRNEP